MCETVVEMDDQLMEKISGSGEVTTEEILQCLRRERLERRLVPALCGSLGQKYGHPPPSQHGMVLCFPSPLKEVRYRGSIEDGTA